MTAPFLFTQIGLSRRKKKTEKKEGRTRVKNYDNKGNVEEEESKERGGRRGITRNREKEKEEKTSTPSDQSRR